MSDGNNSAQAETAAPVAFASIEDAAASFDAAHHDPERDDESNSGDDTAPEADTGGSEADATSELAPDDESRPNDADNAETEGAQQSGKPPELDLDSVLNIKDLGQTKLRDLVEGNLRQADYTRKSQDVAQARRFVAERAQVMQQAERELQAALSFVGNFIQSMQPQPPAPTPDDPFDYVAREAHYKQQQQAWNNLTGGFQQQVQLATARSEAMQKQAYAEHRQAEQVAFLEKYPDFRDPKKVDKLIADLQEANKVWGLPPEYLDLHDHRLAPIYLDALELRMMKAAKAKADVKTAGKTAPKTGAPVQQPGRSRIGAPAAAVEKQIADKFRKSKSISIDDAAELQFARQSRRR